MIAHAAIMVLAAGASRRLGAPKQLVELDGRSLVARAVDEALAVAARVFVVVGDAREATPREVLRAIADRPVRVVSNDDARAGMASSLLCGLRAARADDPALEALVVSLCDQPDVDAAHLGRLLHALAPATPIAASSYAGVLGVPAAFARAVFPELDGLIGDRGARDVVRRDPTRVAAVERAEAAHDVDVAADLARIRANGR